MKRHRIKQALADASVPAGWPEDVIVRVLLGRLNQWYPRVWVDRANVRGDRVAYTNRYVQAGTPGQPDIMGRLLGRSFGVECKSPGARQDPDQVAYQRTMQETGGIYLLAVGEYDSVLATVAAWLQDPATMPPLPRWS